MQSRDSCAWVTGRAALVGLVATLAGCSVFTCTPSSIEVASKDQRTRMVSELRGITNDETGRGVDALYATVQMPKGVPVATVAVDGAMNAALLAVQILAVDDAELTEALAAHRAEMAPPQT